MKKFIIGAALAVAILFGSAPKSDALPIYKTSQCIGDVQQVYQLQFINGGFQWVLIGWQGCTVN